MLVPNDEQMDNFKQINFEMGVMHEQLKAKFEEVKMI